MMQIGVVSQGSLLARVLVNGDGGLTLDPDVLSSAGLHPGDEVEIHGDGSMLMVVPAPADGPEDPD